MKNFSLFLVLFALLSSPFVLSLDISNEDKEYYCDYFNYSLFDCVDFWDIIDSNNTIFINVTHYENLTIDCNSSNYLTWDNINYVLTSFLNLTDYYSSVPETSSPIDTSNFVTKEELPGLVNKLTSKEKSSSSINLSSIIVIVLILLAVIIGYFYFNGQRRRNIPRAPINPNFSAMKINNPFSYAEVGDPEIDSPPKESSITDKIPKEFEDNFK